MKLRVCAVAPNGPVQLSDTALEKVSQGPARTMPSPFPLCTRGSGMRRGQHHTPRASRGGLRPRFSMSVPHEFAASARSTPIIKKTVHFYSFDCIHTRISCHGYFCGFACVCVWVCCRMHRPERASRSNRGTPLCDSGSQMLPDQ